MVERQRAKQEALEAQLRQTLDAVNSTQGDLMAIREAVMAHAPGEERSAMLGSIERIRAKLEPMSSGARP